MVQQTRLTAGLAERLLSAALFAGVAAALAWGWWQRHDRGIDPHHGLGYALGIIGGAMMLVLLGYPLRKRLGRSGRRIGSIGFWFRFHMALGLIGPLAVLYHARFSWGALNSAFALGSMIIVAGSGLVGRFFYSRVHRGYSDRKLEMRGLKEDMDALLVQLGVDAAASGDFLATLHRLEARAVAAGGQFWSSTSAVVGIGVGSRLAERRLLRNTPEIRCSPAMRAALHHYFQAVRRAAEFAFYDRLLRLWHLFHLPLFVMLVAAAVLHVVAVHMY